MKQIAVAGYERCPFHIRAVAAAQHLSAFPNWNFQDNRTFATETQFLLWLDGMRAQFQDERVELHNKSPFVFDPQTLIYIGGCDEFIAMAARLLMPQNKLCHREILFGLGCFWYAQHLFEPTPGEPSFPGALETEVGYAGRTNSEMEFSECGCSSQEVVRISFSSGQAAHIDALDHVDPLIAEVQKWWKQHPQASTLRKLLRTFWRCQDHLDGPSSHFSEGYEIKIVVFEKQHCKLVEQSRGCFQQDLQTHFGCQHSVDYVRIVDASKESTGGPTFITAEQRHQHWFYKGSLPDVERPGGQSSLSRKGLAAGMGALAPDILTPALDHWAAASGLDLADFE